MLRRLLILLALAGLPAAAAIWPDPWGAYPRSSLNQLNLVDRAVWEEYGLQAAEQAQYSGFTATGYRLKDPTSALAVYQWLKPGGGQPSPLAKYAIQRGSRLLLLRGNYVLDFNGRIPSQQELNVLDAQLPRLDQSALPSLVDYLPAANLVGGTERYVTGPESLRKFEPRIPPSVAAFSLGAEAQLARYKSPKGELNLALFYYLTPQMARERATAFQGIQAARVKRSGPLVAVVLSAPDADEAERLLAKVNYQVTITWDQRPAKPSPGIGEILIGGVLLVSGFAGFALLCGLLYAGVRIGWRRWTGRPDDEEMTTLGLDGSL